MDRVRDRSERSPLDLALGAAQRKRKATLLERRCRPRRCSWFVRAWGPRAGRCPLPWAPEYLLLVLHHVTVSPRMGGHGLIASAVSGSAAAAAAVPFASDRARAGSHAMSPPSAGTQTEIAW